MCYVPTRQEKIHISNNCLSVSESATVSVDNASIFGHAIEDRLPGKKKQNQLHTQIQIQITTQIQIQITHK